jgi:hypothetical protein
MAVLGKILVLLNVLLSVLCLVFALGVFTNSINWGWKPEFHRQEFGTKVASELDKRKATLQDLAESRKRYSAAWLTARAKMIKSEANIAKDQLRYVKEVERIESGKESKIAEITTKNENQWLTEKNKKIGQPLFQGNLTKSYEGYRTEIAGLTKEITDMKEKILAIILDKEKDFTEKLIGKEEKKGKREKGLYALIRLEEEIQHRAEEEIKDLRDIYVQEQVDSELYLRRQRSLRLRLRQLEEVAAKQQQR